MRETSLAPLIVQPTYNRPHLDAQAYAFRDINTPLNMSRMEIHRSWSVVSAVSLTIFTWWFVLLAAVIVWSSKANAPADVASSPTGVLTLEFVG